MSQQGPGGYGGGGPHGPPGGGGGGYGGGPPGGYPPPPPGGYGPPFVPPPGGYGGPPGYGPPGYGPPGAPPPNYGQPQYGAPGGSPSPGKSPLIWLGLGCGVLVLLGAVGGIVGFLSMRKKANDVEQQIALAASGVALGASALAPAGVPASSVCAKTIACCQAIAAKSGSSADLAGKACAAYANLADAVCAEQYPTLKQTAAAMGGSCE